MADWFDDVTKSVSEFVDDAKDFASESIDDIAERCWHSTTKKKSDEELKATEQDFNNCCTTLQNACANLNKIREDSSAVIIPIVEAYINTLANSPKELDNSFTSLNHELKVYQQTKNNYYNSQTKKTSTSTEHTSEAILAVSSAIGIATDRFLTFGVETAISACYKRNQNEQSIEENKNTIIKFKKDIVQIEIKIKLINEKIEETTKFRRKILQLVTDLQNNAPKNYLDFNQYQEKELTALINNVNSFSKLLNTSV